MPLREVPRRERGRVWILIYTPRSGLVDRTCRCEECSQLSERSAGDKRQDVRTYIRMRGGIGRGLTTRLQRGLYDHLTREACSIWGSLPTVTRTWFVKNGSPGRCANQQPEKTGIQQNTRPAPTLMPTRIIPNYSHCLLLFFQKVTIILIFTLIFDKQTPGHSDASGGSCATYMDEFLLRSASSARVHSAPSSPVHPRISPSMFFSSHET